MPDSRFTQGQLADAVGLRRLAPPEVEPSGHTLRSPSCAAGAAGLLPAAL